MKAYQTTVNDKRVWRVKYPDKSKKSGYSVKKYATRDEAEVGIKNYRLVQSKAGKNAAKTAVTNELTTWQALDKALRAHRLSLQIVAEQRLEQLRKVKSEETIFNAIGACVLAYKDMAKRKRTIEDLESRTLAFAKYVGEDILVSSITSSTINSYLNTISNLTTRHNHRACISQLFTFCVEKQWCSFSPVQKLTKSESNALKKYKQQSKLGHLDIENVRDLLIEVEKCEDFELSCYFVISIFAGVRSGEFRKDETSEYIKWGDINLDESNIYIPASVAKKGVERSIEIQLVLVNWLEHLRSKVDISNYSKNKPLMPEKLSYRLRKWKEKRGIRIPQNALRHTFATFACPIFGASKTATWAGSSEQLIKSTYASVRGIYRKDCEDFWSLSPESVLAEKIVNIA